MSIKQRLNAAEKKAGIGADVDIIVFRTIYRDQDGNAARETAFAIISGRGSKQPSITVTQNEDEKRDEFEGRVETACLDAFGSLPRDWKVGAS